MSRGFHRVYIILMSVIVIAAVSYFIYNGISYYSTGLEERAFHPDHKLLKPSGPLGHGLGIFGSFFMITGVALYMARKRFRIMSRAGVLKHWLEFHIFLCTLGPFLVLFHTALKFGGLVAISFWSMVAVFLSGIVGRFIYLQIPRSIEGRELSLNEIRDMKTDIASMLRDTQDIDSESFDVIMDSVKRKAGIYYNNIFVRLYNGFRNDLATRRRVRNVLRRISIPSEKSRQIMRMVKNDIRLNRRIEQLETMQNMFKYWHVIHQPFALVMLIIMIIHVAVTVAFGYRWIF